MLFLDEIDNVSKYSSKIYLNIQEFNHLLLIHENEHPISKRLELNTWKKDLDNNYYGFFKNSSENECQYNCKIMIDKNIPPGHYKIHSVRDKDRMNDFELFKFEYLK
jgi:hypothetical protein